MKRLLSVLVATSLMILGVMAPADAKPKPPPPDGCTFAKGMTTCTDTTQTTGPGPQDGMACTTSSGLPGTYSQERTTTTTTTTTYKGKSTSGTPTSTRTTTSTSDGPVTCEATPVSTGTLVVVVDRTFERCYNDPTPVPRDDSDACYRVIGTGLEPGSLVMKTVTHTPPGGTPITSSSGFRYVTNDDGTFNEEYGSLCTAGDFDDLYFTGTGADGLPVTSNTVDPCTQLG
ncbi:hypothetical protein ACLH0K_03770 [Arthrobacter sp. MPF02]|uniref:hypothetical protein n=1 Tax=Arthrobacter sp. MPF02 TaxID=3388492 RepID=UPI003984A950